MSQTAIHAIDLQFFSTIVSCGSLSSAARELGISTAAVSKHLALIEQRLGLPLVNRTTRRMSLTVEGEVYLDHARKILADLETMAESLSLAKVKPRGLLRINATLGFGRTHIAPLISRFAKAYPEVEVQLQLSVNLPSVTVDAYDVGIRFGRPPDSRVIAKLLGRNQRVLCASPSYLTKYGVPKQATDLLRHNCIGIRQGAEAYGHWRLETKGDETTVRAHGNLSTNDGEIAVRWALDGHGIVMRAHWDVERHLLSGKLVQVLAHYDTPEADIYAVYPARHHLTARVQVFVEFLTQGLLKNRSAK
jgi:LysR family transcriptional regulator, transcriptional activator for dmlA